MSLVLASSLVPKRTLCASSMVPLWIGSCPSGVPAAPVGDPCRRAMVPAAGGLRWGVVQALLGLALVSVFGVDMVSCPSVTMC